MRRSAHRVLRLVAFAAPLTGCDALWEDAQRGARALHLLLPLAFAASVVPAALAVVQVFRRTGKSAWVLGAGALALVAIAAAALVSDWFAWSPGALGRGSLGILGGSIAPVFWVGLAAAAYLRRARAPTPNPLGGALAVIAGAAPGCLYAAFVVVLASHDLLPARSPVALTFIRQEGFAVQDDGSVVRWAPRGRRRLDPDLRGLRALSPAAFWTCATLGGGRAACWVGEQPKQWLPDAADVEEIALDDHRICVRRTSRVVDCQALPESGTRFVFGPWERVPGLEATAIARHDAGFCAVRTGGTVACWGMRADLLPEGAPLTAPLDVEGLEHVARLVMTRFYGCTLDETGRARCWGNDHLRRPSGAVAAGAAHAPVELPGWAAARDLSSGGDTACVVTSGGAVSCIDPPFLRAAGMTAGPLDHPVDVGLPGRAVRVFVGDSDVCARLEDGSMWCFGADGQGELLGEEPRNCQQDNLHLTVTPCVDAPQRFLLAD